jgi:diketogulonate reductase-like aldo/keto reductase
MKPPRPDAVGGWARYLDRRKLLLSLVSTGAALSAPAATKPVRASHPMQQPPMITRAIPSTGEAMPVIGLGTWQAFDVGDDPAALAERRQVLEILFAAGGRMIDSSPMYGRAEAVVGRLLGEMGARDKAFLATKVWVSGEIAGVAQMQASMEKMHAGKTLDLMQIHNLVDWRTHLRTLRAWQAEGRVRRIGITHFTVSAFDELMAIMQTETIDFVQLPYSLAVRAAEDRLLPLAADKGIAVIPNRPFDGANMFQRVKGRALPDFAAEIGASSFAQLFLKYLVGHPAVTCVIPGTASPAHMRDNVAAGVGPMPNTALRRRIVDWFEKG